jgi:hypothetical protein
MEMAGNVQLTDSGTELLLATGEVTSSASLPFQLVEAAATVSCSVTLEFAPTWAVPDDEVPFDRFHV